MATDLLAQIINWDRFDSVAVAWLVIFHSFVFQLTIPNGTQSPHLFSAFYFECHCTFRRFILLFLLIITKMENGILNRILSLVSMNKTEEQPRIIHSNANRQSTNVKHDSSFLVVHSCSLFLVIRVQREPLSLLHREWRRFSSFISSNRIGSDRIVCLTWFDVTVISVLRNQETTLYCSAKI